MIQWNVHQQITIQNLRVGSVSNSSVFQIGSAGSIQSLSQLFNTGGYTEPAPQIAQPYPPITPAEGQEESSALSLVPFRAKPFKRIKQPGAPEKSMELSLVPFPNPGG